MHKYFKARHPGRDCPDPVAMDGVPEQTVSFAIGDCIVKSSVHILVLWIPAIPAGMTVCRGYLYNDERISQGFPTKLVETR